MPKLFKIACIEVDTGYPNRNPLYSVDLTLEQIKKLREIELDKQDLYLTASLRGAEWSEYGFTYIVNDYCSQLQAKFPDINMGLGYKLCGQGEKSGDLKNLFHSNKGLLRRFWGLVSTVKGISDATLVTMETEDSSEKSRAQQESVRQAQREKERRDQVEKEKQAQSETLNPVRISLKSKRDAIKAKQAQQERDRVTAQQERERQEQLKKEQLAKEAAEKARATMPDMSRQNLKLTAAIPIATLFSGSSASNQKAPSTGSAPPKFNFSGGSF